MFPPRPIDDKKKKIISISTKQLNASLVVSFGVGFFSPRDRNVWHYIHVILKLRVYLKLFYKYEKKSIHIRKVMEWGKKRERKGAEKELPDTPVC